MKTSFRPGRNIALKIPPHQFEETVSFYRDTLQLRQLESAHGSIGFDFDGKDLWLDSVDTASHAEVWFEICADDLEAAKAHFQSQKVVRRDEIEKLPPNFEGFWITNPSGTIHLVTPQSIASPTPS